MKTIVVATDFSKNSKNATLYALQLAREWRATLLLFHAYRFPPENLAKAGDFPLSVQVIREESEKALKQLGKELHAQLSEPITIKYILREGYVLPCLQEVTEEVQADLLVMSTVGTAPQSAQLFGSVATAMIPLTNVPLLLIPPDVTYAPVKNLVLGVDLNSPPNAVVLDSVIQLSEQLGAVVNVLCINTHPDEHSVQRKAQHIRHLLQEVPHTLTIQPGDDVFDTLLDFAQANKADLIMMLPQEHSWITRLFKEGETQRVARLTDIPLLAVR